MRRATILNNTENIVDRYINDDYSKVIEVGENLIQINNVSAAIGDGTFDSAATVIQEPLKSAIENLAGISTADLQNIAAIDQEIIDVAGLQVEIGNIHTNLAEILNADVQAGNAAASALAASTSELNAEDSNLESQDWATKTTGVVNTYTGGIENADGTEYSAKKYAIDANLDAGYAQEWAISPTDVSVAAGGGVGVSSAKTHREAAEAAQLAAEGARDAAQVLYNQFGDRYLGSHVDDAAVAAYVVAESYTLDTGDIYFNTTDNKLRFYSGAAWYVPEESAATSATNAATSETNAATSELAAEDSNLEAAEWASNTVDNVHTYVDGVRTTDTGELSAKAQAQAAAGSASSASTDAGTATTQAGIATTQAGTATTQAGIATTQAGLATDNAGYAQEWAVKATAVSSAAGGDDTTTFSSKYWAEYTDSAASDFVTTTVPAQVTSAQGQLDTYRTGTVEPAIDSYLTTPVTGIYAQLDTYETGLEADLQDYVDNATTGLKKQLDDHELVKEGELDTYLTGTVEPALDSYRSTTVEPALDTYRTTIVEPAINTYRTGTVQPAIDLYRTGTVEPAIDSYVTTNVQPGLDANIGYAEEWAIAAVPVSIAAGGDGSTTYSAKYWAGQAQASATGSLVYRGSWDAQTSLPSSPALGDYYKVNAAGPEGAAPYTYNVGDSIIYNGTTWDHIDNTDLVASVDGQIGVVDLSGVYEPINSTSTHESTYNHTNYDKTVTATGTATNIRYDKILGTLDVIAMDYTSGDLDFVRYTGDNDTDTYYRDVMVYTTGNLTSVKHFYNTADLITPSATTILGYDGSNNLITVSYSEA